MKIHRKWLWTIATLAIMVLIWWFSSADGLKSSAQSGFFSRLLFWLEPKQASFLVRKTAHFTIYLLLGVAMNRTLKAWGISGKGRRQVLVVLLCFLYAGSDEFHQTFVGGRSGQFQDVLLDTAGSLTGTLLLAGFDYWKGRQEKSPAQAEQ